MRLSRQRLVSSLLGLTFAATAPMGAGFAQKAPAAPPAATPPAAAAAPADPVVATVDGHPVHLSDVSDAAQGLPEQMRGMPPATLFPMVMDQLIDREAVVLEARRQGLDKDPGVIRDIARAQETALQNALIKRDVGPQITEAAIRARYDKDIAGKPGEEEVDAAHILLANEADAVRVIGELKGGADFAELAKKNSTDPAGAQGGDLGFFKKGDMLPEFSEAAFKMQPGEITQKPVQTRYGWHVIKVIARRTAPPPTFEQAHDELRQQMIQDGVLKVVEKSRADAKIVRFNADGSPIRATDQIVPPPAPPK